MGVTLTYRSCHPVRHEQETQIRQAADVANREQSWILTIFRDERDGRLYGAIAPAPGAESDRVGGAARTWPGPYEAQRLLDALCGISRETGVEWEIRDDTCLRPIGVIRGGVCHADHEAMAESARNRFGGPRKHADG